MDAVRTSGEELVRTGSVSQSTLQAVVADICTTEELIATANAYWDREFDGSEYRPA
jgi:hypothetical protein